MVLDTLLTGAESPRRKNNAGALACLCPHLSQACPPTGLPPRLCPRLRRCFCPCCSVGHCLPCCVSLRLCLRVPPRAPLELMWAPLLPGCAPACATSCAHICAPPMLLHALLHVPVMEARGLQQQSERAKRERERERDG